MNLQTKFLCGIIASVLTVLVGSETLRQRHEASTIGRLSQDNLKRLEATTEQHLQDLQESVQISLRDAMEKGDMDRMIQILNWQQNIHGLLECSIIGTKGTVTYSSLPSALKRALDAPLKQALFTGATKILRQTEDAFELYQPLVAQKACVECHTDWKEGQIGGVELIRFSNADYRQAQKEWVDSTARQRQASLLSGVWVSIGILVVLVVVVNLLVRWLLARPLAHAAGVLAQVSRGDLTSEVEPKLQARQDEIGALSRSVQVMTESLRKLLHEVADGVRTLAAASTELTTISKHTAGGVKRMSDSSSTVKSRSG